MITYNVMEPSVKDRVIAIWLDTEVSHREYALAELRSQIDTEKCMADDNRNVRHSLIRKITTERYRSLRRMWRMLNS